VVVGESEHAGFGGVDSWGADGDGGGEDRWARRRTEGAWERERLVGVGVVGCWSGSSSWNGEFFLFERVAFHLFLRSGSSFFVLSLFSLPREDEGSSWNPRKNGEGGEKSWDEGFLSFGEREGRRRTIRIEDGLTATLQFPFADLLPSLSPYFSYLSLFSLGPNVFKPRNPLSNAHLPSHRPPHRPSLFSSPFPSTRSRTERQDALRDCAGGREFFGSWHP